MSPQNSSIKNISGIILSGGVSSRFQIKNQPWQDKAMNKVNNNETALEKTISCLARICNEIIVVVNNKERRILYQPYITKAIEKHQTRINLITDNHQYFCSGPSLGLISALPFVTNQYTLIVPVDMPSINSNVLLEIITKIDNASLVVPFWSSTGKIEPLVFVANLAALKNHSNLLRYIKEGRADDIFRLAPIINFLTIRKDKEKIASNVFLSMNAQKDFSLESPPLSNDSYATDLFSIKDSIKYPGITDNSLVEKTIDLMDKIIYRMQSAEAIANIINFSKVLMNYKMYFYAAIVLQLLIDSLPLKSLKENESYMKDIIEVCYNSYLAEAKRWEEYSISFLALHSYLDALKIATRFLPDLVIEIETKIVALKKKMKISKKSHLRKSFNGLLQHALPNFLTKAKEVIREAEVTFNKTEPDFETDFLWDHSYRVGKIAFKIALMEGIDPLIPTVAALLHDAGKFVLGEYHKDNKTEEEHSASIAEKILIEEGMAQNQIKKVQKAIAALYNDSMTCDINCKIVYDADRLEKLGTLGIANFFTKSTLRGVNLSQTIVQNLSRELTYAALASKTMLTQTGCLLASEKSKKTITFFVDLLEEMLIYDLGKYYLKEYEVKDGLIVLLVIPACCNQCDGTYTISISIKPDLKCEKMTAQYTCTKCNYNYTITFCLPLIVCKSQ